MHQGHEQCNSPMRTGQQPYRKLSHSIGKIVELSEVMQSMQSSQFGYSVSEHPTAQIMEMLGGEGKFCYKVEISVELNF